MGICRWVRAGLRDYLFEAIIVGEPAPTGITIDRKRSKASTINYQLFKNRVCETDSQRHAHSQPIPYYG
jgi:hypothetical protein